MATHENIAHIKNTEEGWDGKTGAQVEDFICTQLNTLASDIEANNIVSGVYDNTSRLLTLHKGEGSVEVKLEVVDPEYLYGIKVFGIEVNGVKYEEGDLTVNNTSDVNLLVGIYGTVKTVGDPTDLGGQIDAFISVVKEGLVLNTITKPVGLLPKENFTFDYNGDITNISGEPQRISLRDLWNQSYSKVTISVTIDGKNKVYSSSYDKGTITCEIPVLKYDSSVYTTGINDVTFSLAGGTLGLYVLEGFNNGKALVNLSSLTYSLFTPGLNLLVVRAVHATNPTIVSNWVNVDIIYLQGCEETVVAVNKVSSGITNNGVATLYHLTVYSPNRDEVTLTTYLENVEGLSSGTNKIKTETISASNYDENRIYETEYKKYIEQDTSGNKYLMVNCGDEYYTFYTPTSLPLLPLVLSIYKTMTVESPNVNFVYYKEAPINYNFDQITGLSNNVFVNLNPNLEASDGWKENDGICYFKVSAQQAPVFVNPLNLNLQATSGFSLEFGFNAYNISNRSTPIMTLGKLLLWPTQLVWWENGMTESDKTFTARNSLFSEGSDTHIMITVNPNYKLNSNDPYYPRFLQGFLDTFDSVAKSFTYHLVRVYINGEIDREYTLSNVELAELAKQTLQINPTTADINYYLFRVYNSTALSEDLVRKNYNSFIFDKLAKLKFYEANDILKNDGSISFAKSRLKYNTLVLVLPKGLTFPNYTWKSIADIDALIESNAAALFILYANPIINLLYGGRLNSLLIDGQGSSAKRYLIWNVANKFNKFKDSEGNKLKSKFISYNSSNFNSLTNKFTTDEATLKGYYEMPTYEGQVDTSSQVKKAVGKVNWASSMQSHKIGACKLFEDAYKEIHKNSLPTTTGKKAVHEEPFLYFYWETDLEYNSADPYGGVGALHLADLLQHDADIKFAGFQTWGAGKGDDFESGYDEDVTPEYIMLEGGENKNPAVNFRVPWHALQNVKDGKLTAYPTITKDDSINNPTEALCVYDESIAYNSPKNSAVGAWDIDFGWDDGFISSTSESFKKFREFYDFVYKNDFTFKTISSNEIIDSTELTETSYKYAVLSLGFSINGTKLNTHKPGDLYRYDILSEAWVPAGLYYNTTDNLWERASIYDGIEGDVKLSDVARGIMLDTFASGITKYIDVLDIAFHQAFIKFVSGTDNRAKNTYFQIIGPIYEETTVLNDDGSTKLDDKGEPVKEFIKTDKGDYRIRLIGDDLDSIFVTDNVGNLTKPYNLLEPSYDSSFTEHWGDANNVFFYMFDVCFEPDIRKELQGIIDKAFKNAGIENKDTYFYKNVFAVQENFPAVAYNHTAKFYYENAYIIKNLNVINGYENNGYEPLGLSHGSCLQCEKQFMIDRMNFLCGYALTNLGTPYPLLDSTGSSGSNINLLLKFTPYLDFYPNYGFGASGASLTSKLITPEDYDPKTDIIATKCLVKKDILYERKIREVTSEINLGLYQTSMYKVLDILGLQGTTLPSLLRGVQLVVDNNNITEEMTPFQLSSFEGSYPVLENLTLKLVKLPSVLDLSECIKLTTINLQGSSNVTKVIFPETGRLTTVNLPDSVTTLELYNNPNLTSVAIESVVEYDGTLYYEETLESLKTIYVDSGKCKKFDLSTFCEKLLNSSALEEIDLRNVELRITEEVLNKLIYIPKCNITGRITVIDTNGNTKAISYKTKEKLVNTFGDITSSDNTLYVAFTESEIRDVFVDSDVFVYKPTSVGNSSYVVPSPFSISITSGNDINIRLGENPYNKHVNAYLDISYSINTDMKVATIDQTGNITLKDVSNTESALVTITIRTSRNTFSKTVNVQLKWKAPAIGDFAYYDGTFSSGYNPNKTLIGIVWAKNTINEDSGTVYILGKEYATEDPKYLGLGAGKDPSNYSEILDFFHIANTYNNEEIIDLDYDNITDISMISKCFAKYPYSEAITYNTYAKLPNDNELDIDDKTKFKGKSDTQRYVEHVNGMLKNLYNKGVPFSNYILVQNGIYSIGSLSDLENLEQALSDFAYAENNQIKNPNLASSLLFPYFYSMYLYEPKLNSGEVLNELYKAGNWYAPSAAELARVIYYRGYSVNGRNFSADSVYGNISTTITTSGNSIPIFSLAKDRGYLPTCWSSIANNDANNITTTVINCENWGYKRISKWDNNNYFEVAGWAYGNPEYNMWTEYQTSRYAWRGITHLGIPFVEFNYKNDSK